MLKRIVKMSFQADQTEAFEEIFRKSAPHIRQQPGCHHLELWRDKAQSNTFFTFSIWESTEALNDYRKSELFGNVWPLTKTMFSTSPEAWSVDVLEVHE